MEAAAQQVKLEKQADQTPPPEPPAHTDPPPPEPPAHTDPPPPEPPAHTDPPPPEPPAHTDPPPPEPAAQSAAPRPKPAAHGTMVVPPAFGDLGKPARDIFEKGFGYGQYKLDLKAKSQSGVEFSTSGCSNSDTGKSLGHLETKCKMSDLGLSLNQKWNTENRLTGEITVEDQLVKGLKLSLDTSFVPNTGKKSAKLKTAYKRDHMNLGCDVDFDLSGPTVHAAAVLGWQGWLAGLQLAFDSSKSKLTQNNVAVGYQAGDFQLHGSINDWSEYSASIYQKVTCCLHTAVHLAWTAGSNNSRFGIGTKYQLSQDISLSAKVNTACLVGLGSTHTLRPGIKLTLSALIDGKSLNGGGHKIGMGFEVEV